MTDPIYLCDGKACGDTPPCGCFLSGGDCCRTTDIEHSIAVASSEPFTEDTILKASFFTTLDEMQLFILLVENHLHDIENSRDALGDINDVKNDQEIKSIHNAYDILAKQWGLLATALKTSTLSLDK